MRAKSFQGMWAFVAGGAIGVLVAFPLAAPLFGGRILEPVATLWGNALGAVGAVAAAIWAADRGATQQRRQAATLIYAMTEPIANGCQELTSAYGLIPSMPFDSNTGVDLVQPDDWQKIRDLVSRAVLPYYAFENNIHRIESVLSYLDPYEIQVFIELDADLKTACRGIIDSISRESSNAAVVMYGGPGYGTNKSELIEINDRIQKNTAEFRKSAR